MKHRIEFHAGGGIFSHIGLLLENLLNWDRNGALSEGDSIYIENRHDQTEFSKRKTALSDIGFNMFDLLFDQGEPDVSGALLTSLGHPVYLDEFNAKKLDYKEISKKYLKLNNEIESLVNDYINENFDKGKMLGVHVRMTDMNIHHPYLGQVKNSHYLDLISQVIKEENVSKIFVASDNFETLEILKKEFGDMIINYETPYRVDTSYNEERKGTMKWIYEKQFYIDSFIDAVLLSKCDLAIGRISLFNWGAQSFHWSNIEKYFHIDGDKSDIKDPNL